MSGVIDPLLTRDPQREPAETTSDVTALLRQRRPRLVRLAAAIALDRRLAIEIVDRATTDLLRHIGSVDDPARELERTVVQRAAALAGRPRIDRSRQGRRRLASTRPAPLSPVFDRCERAAVWHTLTTLEPRQRALVVLADWPTGWRGRRGCAELADVTGWPRRAVSSLLEEGIRRVGAAAPDPATADAQVADALAAAMAQLGDEAEEPPGHEVAVRALDAGAPAPSVRAPVGVVGPRRGRTRRWAWVLAALVLVTASVVSVWTVSDGGDASATEEAGTAPADERLIRPQWFDMLRPLVPERFDRLALVAHGRDEIAFLAADTITGRTLDIRVDRRGWQPVAFAPPNHAATGATVDPSADPSTGGGTATVTAVAGGVRVVRADGAAVQVTCERCEMTAPDTAERPPDVGAIADAVASGFALEDVGSGFGAPDTSAGSARAVAEARAAVASVEPVQTVESLDRAADGTASGQTAVVRLRAPVGEVEVLVVRGLVPVPARGVRPQPMVVDGGRVGWLLSPNGVGVRITLVGPAGVRGADALDDLLDAVERAWSDEG